MNKILSSIYTFIFVGILFLGCTYWIYKNIKVSDLIGNSPVIVSKKDVDDVVNKEIEVRNNDIVRVVSPDAVELIVDGGKIEGFESFSDINISPDGKKISFIVHTITPQWLYASDIDGGNLIKIGLGKNSFWSPDSKYIAFNNHTTDVSPIDVYIYSVNSGITKNLTMQFQKVGYFRQYSNISWLSNDLIESAYVEFPENDLNEVTKGLDNINLDATRWDRF